LINAAFSENTWKSHYSAINCLQIFCNVKNFQVTWPLSINVVNNFTNWALTEKKLKANTVSKYLSSLSLFHSIRGLDQDCCFNKINKLMLKGAENLESLQPVKNKRNIMTLPLLKILGHEIANCNWTAYKKQLVWTISCLAFFGSFRIGELLCNIEDSFDPSSDLTWDRVKFQENSLLIHVKSPKSKNKGGDMVDIFEFKGHNCCPIKSFMAFNKLASDKNYKKSAFPVFRNENGKNFTKQQFNAAVSERLKIHTDKLNAKITGHSFRAAIPSVLAKFPDLAKDDHIMGWGRWDSKAYLSYTRLKTDQRKNIFSKIVLAFESVNK